MGRTCRCGRGVRGLNTPSHPVRPDMKAAGGGAIIIVSSIGGLRGSSEIGLYCISKAADMQLARNLCGEWGPENIRVNCIAPGFIASDMTDAMEEKAIEQVTAQIPMGRFGQSEDIANAALYLASDMGTYVTGSTLVVDGGIAMR